MKKLLCKLVAFLKGVDLEKRLGELAEKAKIGEYDVIHLGGNKFALEKDGKKYVVFKVYLTEQIVPGWREWIAEVVECRGGFEWIDKLKVMGC